MNDYKELVEMLRSMSKAIVREDANYTGIPEENIWDADANALADAADAIEQLVKERDAEPVRHGHWIDAYPDIESNPMFIYGICSECGFEQGLSNKLHYCPNCGAKMHEISE